MIRRTLPLVAWVAFLVVALAALHGLGDGALGAPPAGDLGPWLEQTGPATAAFALLRIVALALGWYLLATTLAATVLRLLRADRAATGVERTAPAFVRRLVRGAAGLTLAAGAMTSVAAADDAAVTMRRLDQEPPVTMRRLPPDAPPPPAAPAPVPDPPAATRTWTVAPGQSFWTVAELVLTESWQRPPSDDQIDPYWRQLVEANRSQLADPSNPDLLFPEQVLHVPPPPAAPHV